MLYILVTGDREWWDVKAVGAVLRSIGEPFTLVHGDARGADRIAAAIASRMMMGVEAFPANWEVEGRAAGPIRNRRMLLHVLQKQREGHEVRVIAFHPDLSQSRGTANMVKLAKRAKLRVTHVKGRKKRFPADGLYRVEGTGFVAGFTVRNGKIVDCAPILRRNIKGWTKYAVWVCD